MSPAGPLPDVLDEARRLVALADDAGTPVRLLGGTAIHLRVGTRVAIGFRRAPKDIDVAVPAGAGGTTASLLTAAGYVPDDGFNMLEGSRRMLFYDTENARQLDVFVREFTMCHRIPIDERLLLEPVTIPLAELMLTKLQIVQLNRKDEIDVLAMLCAHGVGERDGETINATRIAELCARDWGLCHTATINLDRLRARIAGDAGLAPADAERITAGLAAITDSIQSAPKSSRWRLRARVGERVRWYDEPDEVDAA
jgi:hypothetical protein